MSGGLQQVSGHACSYARQLQRTVSVVKATGCKAAVVARVSARDWVAVAVANEPRRHPARSSTLGGTAYDA